MQKTPADDAVPEGGGKVGEGVRHQPELPGSRLEVDQLKVEVPAAAELAQQRRHLRAYDVTFDTGVAVAFR